MFKKNLSQKDIDHYVALIEKKYKAYSALYSQYYSFNVQDFRDRYMYQLKMKGSLELFFKKEIELLEDILRDISHKELEKDNNSIKKSMDSIADSIIKGIDGYPEEFIHERANIEIRKLIGMVKFILPDINAQRDIIHLDKYTYYKQSVEDLNDFVEEPYSSLYQNYLKLLDSSLTSITQIEAEGQKILKHIATTLKTILMLLSEIPDNSYDKPSALIEYLEAVIVNFRMEIF